MPPHNNPRLRILSVGGNAISAFLSWRLSATNNCDVSLVWKNNFESVHQYGVSFRSSKFGNERFKPRLITRTPQEARELQKGSFDYVLLCVKALPELYDLASIIESVVTPQHTCILVNTSNSLGVESLIEERYPQNVVLSLVSAADLTQIGPAEFEHNGDSQLWVGPANLNPDIPQSIQADMAAALAMTLSTGQVDCEASKNIQQQQFERMIGPVAYYPASVLFETPSFKDLLEIDGVKELVSDVIDEVMQIASKKGCTFAADFKDKTMTDMAFAKESDNIMYQDYSARRPMEVESYLGSPVKLAKAVNVNIPRLQTLHTLLQHVNIANQKRPAAPRMDGPPTPRAVQPPNGMGPGPVMMPPPGRGRGGSRAPSMTGPPPPQMMRRPPPGMNGHGPPPGHPRGHPQMQRRPSYESNLDEFSHLVMYDASPDGTSGPGGYVDQQGGSELAFRERELMIRQKELALREREMGMRGGPRHRGAPSRLGDFDEDEGEEEYFDPQAYRGPPVDPDNVDMMSITSRRNKKQASASQLRANPEMMGPPQNRRSNMYGRPPPRTRVSSHMAPMNHAQLREGLMEDPLLGYSSDRFGGVDRSNITREGRESRAASLTTARLNELQQGPPYANGNGHPNGHPNGHANGGYPPMNRRVSQSPGMPLSPGVPPHMHGGPSPPRPGYMSPDGRPSPPGMRQPTPRHPPGHGNMVAPQQVENRAGVSNPYPPPKHGQQVRSLTGSASASAGSGDSGRSAQISNENSAYSSQSSLGPRPPIGVR